MSKETEPRGLRDDHVYQQLTGAERDAYRAAYRKTLAAQMDEMGTAFNRLGKEMAVVLRQFGDRVRWGRR